MKKLPIENKEAGRNGPYDEPFCECKTPFEFKITPLGCSFVNGFLERYLDMINKLLSKDYWNDLQILDKMIFNLKSLTSGLEKRKSEILRHEAEGIGSRTRRKE